MKNALVLFAKAPERERVKTRLVPPLTPGQATDLYICFLGDTVENMRQVDGVDLIVSYTPVGAEHLFDPIAPDCRLIPQRGDGFGVRLFGVFEDLFAEGYDAVCVMDSDSPTLPREFIQAGFAALSACGDCAVLGPSIDGGYYVIGLTRAHRRLFEGITWSTSEVLAETTDAAREIELPVVLLPEWYDVDTAVELAHLREQLQRRNTRAYAAPRTREYLSQLVIEPAEMAASADRDD